jgi:hypothetical protein
MGMLGFLIIFYDRIHCSAFHLKKQKQNQQSEKHACGYRMRTKYDRIQVH